MAQTRLDQLLGRVESETLRQQIADEIAALTDRTKFGLVFEEHLPERVRLPEVPPRRRSKVVLRTDPADAPLRTVTKVTGGRVELSDGTTVDTNDVVVVREYGEPLYPGLDVLERIARGGDKPDHVLIEAENLHALEALAYTHAESVDCIYIDPPYNTGGDLIYNDRYVGKDDAYRHSLWLSFMARRLKLAHKLLKPTGVIFLSIDDNEQHRLRMLLDQVFGEKNFVDTLAVEMSTTSGPKTVNAQQGTIVKNTEFVHIYRKSEKFDDVQHTPLFDGLTGWDDHYSLWLEEDGTIGSFVAHLLADEGVLADAQRLDVITRGKDGLPKLRAKADLHTLLAFSEVAQRFVLDNLDRIARTDQPPVAVKHVEVPVGCYIRVEVDHRDYLVTRTSRGTLNQVYSLRRNFRWSDDYAPRFGRTVIRGDLWKGFHQDMGNVAKEGGIAFNKGKKPIRLISQLIRWANNSPDAVVLDFFAGSGSTAHAVMQMNRDDGGRRQCLLVTNNEVSEPEEKRLRAAGLKPGDPEWERQGIFEQVTRPRVTTVLTGLRPDGTSYSAGLEENLTIAKLTYLDRTDVERSKAFTQIANLLWLQAGAHGEAITTETDDFAAPEGAHYAICFNVDYWEPFVEVVNAREDITHAYVVTDAEESFRLVLGRLRADIRTRRLYENYLTNFTTNTPR